MNRDKKIQKLTRGTSDWIKEGQNFVADQGIRKNARKVALLVLEILEQKNWSQADLAEKMGVSRQQVGKIVRGRENLTFATIDKLERALGITILNIASSAPPVDRYTSQLGIAGSAHTEVIPNQQNYQDQSLGDIARKDDLLIRLDPSLNPNAPIRRGYSLTIWNLKNIAAQLRAMHYDFTNNINLIAGEPVQNISQEYKVSDADRIIYSKS